VFEQRLISGLAERLREYSGREPVQTVADRDEMLIERDEQHLEHYFRVGREAIELVAEALALAGRNRVETALDLPCGYGRVLRHLVSFLAEAHVVGCDIDEACLEFCGQTFGVDTVRCADDFGAMSFDAGYDLIWCGSLLTHLPERSFRSLLALLARSLSERGVAVATLHGRYSPEVQASRFKYLPDADFEIAERGFRERGFGFAPYPGQERFGIALARPSFVLAAVEALEGIRILGYRERAWDDHQDVVVFGKPPIRLEES